MLLSVRAPCYEFVLFISSSVPLNPHFQSSRHDTYARRLHFDGIDILARWDNIGSAENVPIIMDAATGCEARTAQRASTLMNRAHTGVGRSARG